MKSAPIQHCSAGHSHPLDWPVSPGRVRQLVTPPKMLGRVNAMIQTAIYGVRPIAALLGGLLVGATSPQAALTVGAAVFSVSASVVLFSALRNVDSFEDLARSYDTKPTSQSPVHYSGPVADLAQGLDQLDP